MLSFLHSGINTTWEFIWNLKQPLISMISTLKKYRGDFFQIEAFYKDYKFAVNEWGV